MGQLVFHIGHHKTGTSWLQQGFWSEHPQISLLNDFRQPWRDPLLASLIGASERKFDLNQVRQILDCARTTAGIADIHLISAERLSGHPFSGGYDSLALARRLYSLAPDAKIVIGVRHQISMAKSLYIQLVREGYVGSFGRMFTEKSWKRPFFSQDYLCYHHLVGEYQRLFGKERVQLVFFEDLLADAQEFLAGISRFLRINGYEPENCDQIVNPSSEDSIAQWLRRNLCLASEYNSHPAPPDLDPVLKDQWLHHLQTLPVTFDYRYLHAEQIYDSNRRLAAMLGGLDRYLELDREHFLR